MIKHLKTLIPSIVVALLVATAANSAFFQWSKISAQNATADPTIGWAEGMSPSSVNDSARAMMARAAEYRDDISGLLVTGGTSTAYTVTTNQGLNSVPNDGQLLSFTMHATNGAAATLTADSGTTYPLQTAGGTAVSSAVLVVGSPYSVKFSSGSSAWVLHNFYGSPFSIPVGALMPYTGATVPNSNFVLPAGQCISRTTYATYFSLVSTTFGACDGVTTFAVPDMRGRTIAAIDNLGGSAANRLTSTTITPDGNTIGAVGGAQSVTLDVTMIPSHTHTASVTDPSHNHTYQGLSGGGGVASGSGLTAGNLNSGTSTTGVTVSNSNTGGGLPHLNVQPTMVLTYLLRII